MNSGTAPLQSRIDGFACLASARSNVWRGFGARRLLLLSAVLCAFLASCATTHTEPAATPRSTETGQSNAKLLEDATQELAKEGRKLCVQDEYKLIRKKHSCFNAEITPEHMADKSKISDAERPVFSRFASEIKVLQHKAVEAYRNHGGAKGIAIADAMARAAEAAEKNAAALYARTETWGQYNRRRKEISLRTHEEIRKINQQ